MGKATTFLLVMSGLMLLFYIGGLIDVNGSPTSTLLNFVFNPETLHNPDEVDAALKGSGNNPLSFTGILLGSLAAIGILIVGVLTKNIELAAMLSVTAYLLSLGWDFIQVYNVIYNANNVIAILIFGPLFFIYVITMVEFWRGRD